MKTLTKESKDSYINFRQSKFQSKETDQWWRRALHNDKGTNSSTIFQVDIAILNVHVSDNRASDYMRQNLIEGTRRNG